MHRLFKIQENILPIYNSVVLRYVSNTEFNKRFSSKLWNDELHERFKLQMYILEKIQIYFPFKYYKILLLMPLQILPYCFKTFIVL